MKEVAVFTEHCGYYVFPRKNVKITELGNNFIENDYEKLSAIYRIRGVSAGNITANLKEYHKRENNLTPVIIASLRDLNMRFIKINDFVTDEFRRLYTEGYARVNNPNDLAEFFNINLKISFELGEYDPDLGNENEVASFNDFLHYEKSKTYEDLIKEDLEDLDKLDLLNKNPDAKFSHNNEYYLPLLNHNKFRNSDEYPEIKNDYHTYMLCHLYDSYKLYFDEIARIKNFYINIEINYSYKASAFAGKDVEGENKEFPRFEENFPDDAGFAMTPVGTKTTGLKSLRIQFLVKMGINCPRLLIDLTNPKDFRWEDMISVSISDNPQIVGRLDWYNLAPEEVCRQMGVDFEEFQSVVEMIKLNKEVILKHWNCEFDSHDLIEELRKV